MRLREYIDKSPEMETVRGRLLRAIDLIRGSDDIQEVLALISSFQEELSNEDLIFVQDQFDKKISTMRGLL